MRYRYFIALFVLLLAAVGAGAQGITIKILDNNNREPVPDAAILVHRTDDAPPRLDLYTNEKGVINIGGPNNIDQVEIAAFGYETKTIKELLGKASITIFLHPVVHSLDGYVVTGLTMPTPQKDALSNYRIIDKVAIKAQGNINLADALSTQLNMNIDNDPLLGAGIRMQGLGGDKVKIMTNGAEINGRENGNIDLGQINLNNIERIEIVQGPMSVMYGTDALGGVVNLITRRIKKPWEAQVNLNYETVGKYNADFSLSHQLGKRSQLTIGGGRYYFDGWQYNDSLIKYNGIQYPYHRRLLFKPKEQYLANGAYNYYGKSGFQLELAEDFVREKVTNLDSPFIFDPYYAKSSNDYYRTTRSQTRLNMSGNLGKSGHWQSQNYFSLYYRTKNTRIEDLTNLTDTLSSATGAQDTSTFYTFGSRTSYTNHFRKLAYTIGYDARLEYAHSQKVAGEDQSIQDYAAFLQLSYPILKNLTIQPGLRVAYNTRYTTPPTPAVDLLYKVRSNVQVRASYARGFRAPSLKELYLEFIDQNHHILGNPDLKAEYSNHAQLSVSWQPYRHEDNYVQLVATGYMNDVHDEITLVQHDTTILNDYTYANLLRDQNAIANLTAETRLGAFYIQAGFGMQHTFGQSGQYDAFNAPEMTANAQYNWTKTGLTFSAFYKLTGAQPALISDISGQAYYAGRVPAYHIMDASVQRRFLKRRLQVVAGVKNIFNTQSVVATGVNAAPSAHGTTGGVYNFLGRRFFSTVSITLD